MYQWNEMLENEKNEFNSGLRFTQDQKDAFKELKSEFGKMTYPVLSKHPEFDLFLTYLPRAEQIEFEEIVEKGYSSINAGDSDDELSAEKSRFTRSLFEWAEQRISFEVFLKRRNDYAKFVNEFYERGDRNQK